MTILDKNESFESRAEKIMGPLIPRFVLQPLIVIDDKTNDDTLLKKL